MSESKQDYFRCVVETRDNKIPQTEYPTIVLPLPDGTSLRAVAIDDECCSAN